MDGQTRQDLLAMSEFAVVQQFSKVVCIFSCPVVLFATKHDPGQRTKGLDLLILLDEQEKLQKKMRDMSAQLLTINGSLKNLETTDKPTPLHQANVRSSPKAKY